MKINSVSETTGNASLMLFFAADAVSALTALVIWVTQTIFFVAKTLRSVTEIHCFVAKQHCFLNLQHCLATELICFFAWKSFSLNEVALPAPETHCFGVKQHCSGVKQHCLIKLQHYIDAIQYWFFRKQCGFAAKRCCFFMNQHCFLTKTLSSVTMQPSSGSRKPCFFPEPRCSVTKTLASGGSQVVANRINLPPRWIHLSRDRSTRPYLASVLDLTPTLNQILQILSLTLFEKEPILQLLQPSDEQPSVMPNPNQLILFEI